MQQSLLNSPDVGEFKLFFIIFFLKYAISLFVLINFMFKGKKMFLISHFICICLSL